MFRNYLGPAVVVLADLVDQSLVDLSVSVGVIAFSSRLTWDLLLTPDSTSKQETHENQTAQGSPDGFH